jgi:nucleoid-associated protein YgaU
MPNDAKLGLILGVGVVIAVAVVFFQKDPGKEGARAVSSQSAMEARTPRSVPGRKTAWNGERAPGLRHTVQEGDTLPSIAEHYYGDREKSVEIARANRDVLTNPDELTVGLVLTIPDLNGASGPGS